MTSVVIETMVIRVGVAAMRMTMKRSELRS
jgi:hypothetical protein